MLTATPLPQDSSPVVNPTEVMLADGSTYSLAKMDSTELHQLQFEQEQ